jgi:hypothetical protein
MKLRHRTSQDEAGNKAACKALLLAAGVSAALGRLACILSFPLARLPYFQRLFKLHRGVIATQVDMTDISRLHGMDYRAIQLVKYTSLEIDQPIGICAQFSKRQSEAQG